MATQYIYLGVFLWALAEQSALPLPSAPVLLAAGALIAIGHINPVLTIALILTAALAGDLAWYQLGRRYGAKVMGHLCRLSVEPDSCVRKAENAFARYGTGSLLFAKFVPGLSAAATPVAGAIGIPVWRFLLFDTLGTLFWAGSFLVTGHVFHAQVQTAISYSRSAGAVLLVAAVVAALVGYLWLKYTRRKNFLEYLQMARISPEELKRKLDAHEEVAILDLRHPLDFLPEPYMLPGALRVPMEELEQRKSEIPTDKEVIVYCTCPNEATSAMTAMKLRGYGIRNVRPLAGGYHAWRERGFPLTSQFGSVPRIGTTRAEKLKALIHSSGR